MRNVCKAKYVLFIAVLFVVTFSINLNIVNASNDSTNELKSSYNIKTTNYDSGKNAFRVGVKGWSSGTPYKGVNSASNLNAYCVSMNHTVGFTNGTSTKAKCDKPYTKNFTTPRKIIAGYIVEEINKDNSIKASAVTMMVGNGRDTDKITSPSECSKTKGCDWSKREEYARFVYKVVTLNTYMNNFNVTGSVNFTKVNKNKNTERFGRTNDSDGKVLEEKINNYIKNARSSYQNYKDSSTNSALNFKLTKEIKSKVMKKISSGSSSYYISNEVFAFDSADKLKNGAAVKTSVSTSNNPSGSTISFCTDKNGKSSSCVSAGSVSKGKSYYIKISGSSLEGKSLTVTAKATSSFKYPMLDMYCRAHNTKHQAIGIYGNATKSLSDSKSFNLVIPEANSQLIEVAKVDTDGNSLSGAEFQLLVNGKATNWTSTDKESGKFYFKKLDSEMNFSNTKFSLKETSSPNGYSLIGTELPITFGTSGTIYYLQTDDKEETITEEQYNAGYGCKVTTVTTDQDGASSTNYEIKPLDINSSCDGYVSSTGGTTGGTDTDTGSSSETNSESQTPSGDNSGQETGTPSKPTVTTTAEKTCYANADFANNNGTPIDEKYCGSKISLTSNGNYYYVEVKDELTKVKISKVDATGNEEVPGASLKICSKSECDSKKDQCTPAKTNGNTSMEWSSGLSPKEWDGLPTGGYCVVEKVPPLGYKKATTLTYFNVANDGTVTSGNTKATDDTIVIKNSLNEVTISKTDIATTKELPGATLSICEASIRGDDIPEDDGSSENPETITDTDNKTEKVTDDSEASSNNPDDYELVTDDVGDCVPVVLQDGSGDATWTSTDQPHTIKGLPSGTYYLVEKTAPNGYSTAESILFRMNDDGVLTDVKGNTLANNKIEMKDAPIKEVKTGQVRIVAVILICVGAAGAGAYYYFKTNAVAAGVGQVRRKIRKIKGRKLHK